MSSWLPPLTPPLLCGHYLPEGAVDTSVDAALVADLELALEKRRADVRAFAAPPVMGHAAAPLQAGAAFAGAADGEDDELGAADEDQIASDEFSEGAEPFEDDGEDEGEEEDDEDEEDDEEDEEDDDEDLAAYL